MSPISPGRPPRLATQAETCAIRMGPERLIRGFAARERLRYSRRSCRPRTRFPSRRPQWPRSGCRTPASRPRIPGGLKAQQADPLLAERRGLLLGVRVASTVTSRPFQSTTIVRRSPALALTRLHPKSCRFRALIERIRSPGRNRPARRRCPAGAIRSSARGPGVR